MPNGGIIGPDNVPTTVAASGVWTINEVADARREGIWPVPVPSVVTNAALWLDAADATTITESGGAVSQWDNKGSLGNFTQATAALQPTTGSTTLNGLNVIDFAGDYLNSADAASSYKFLHDGSTSLVCMVAKHNGSTKGFLGNNSGTAAQIGFFYGSSSTDTSIGIFITNGSTAPVNAAVANAVTNNVFAVHSALYDPDNATAADRAEMFFDDGSGNKPNTATAAVSSSNPSQVLQLGADGNGTLTLTGSIAELIIVSGADATEVNRQIIRDYLNTKWAVY